MSRDENEDILRSIDSRLQALENEMKTRRDTDKELMQLFQSVRGFMSVLSWFEKLSTWVAKMAVAGGILWFIFKEAIYAVLRGEGK